MASSVDPDARDADDVIAKRFADRLQSAARQVWDRADSDGLSLRTAATMICGGASCLKPRPWWVQIDVAAAKGDGRTPRCHTVETFERTTEDGAG